MDSVKRKFNNFLKINFKRSEERETDTFDIFKHLLCHNLGLRTNYFILILKKTAPNTKTYFMSKLINFYD